MRGYEIAPSSILREVDLSILWVTLRRNVRSSWMEECTRFIFFCGRLWSEEAARLMMHLTSHCACKTSTRIGKEWNGKWKMDHCLVSRFFFKLTYPPSLHLFFCASAAMKHSRSHFNFRPFFLSFLCVLIETFTLRRRVDFFNRSLENVVTPRRRWWRWCTIFFSSCREKKEI